MENETLNNPWKGLNFYVEGEILYGRNYEIHSLSHYIFNNTQTVLYGRSGIGKSSILNAGIFPIARQEGMIPVSIRLKHDNDNNYVLQIRSAILAGGITIKELLPAIDEENENLWEFMHRHTFHNNDGIECTPLLVFDQFEEIFTLQKNESIKRDFFRQLGNLLNDVKPSYIVEYEKKNRLHQLSQQETKVVSSGAFKGLSLNLNIRRKDQEHNHLVGYIERPDYHIVFAMREDFLSSLELYTSSIPVMKDNRFGLLPINEEQAADIIRLPRQGLVDEEVTKLIIEQVTGRTDFLLDGIPEIEVDAAVLSLFLSRLFAKKPGNELKITAELVNKYSGHIIHDFYVDSITSNEEKNEILSKNTILLLENQLLTREGLRNNVSRNDLLAQGVTNEELSILIDKRKLLRQFHHGNDIRVEYIHDILCPVVKERKEQRELLLIQEQEREIQEKEKRKLKKEAKRKLWMTVLISIIVIILSVVLMWNYMPKQTDLLPVKQSFMISFLEDSLTSENEYWKGDFSVIGHRVKAPDTLLFHQTIDKGLRDSIFRLEVDTLRSISFSMKFPSYSKYQDIEFQKDYSELMKELNVQMQLRKKRPITYPYFGNVSVEANGIKWPVQNALICLHDITARTDSCGNFKYYLEKELSADDDIFIIKKGFSSVDFRAADNLDTEKNIHSFVLTPKDSIQTVKYNLAAIDSIALIPGKTVYRIKNQKIFRKDGSTDTLSLLGVYKKTVDKKYIIEGYFYFQSDLRKDNDEDNLYSYYFFTGEIDRNWKDGFKNYSIEGKNYIGNILDITGTYKQTVGTWTGEISSPVGYNAYFPK